MNVKTKSGFKCEIDDRVLEDYRLLEAIALTADSNNQTSVIRGTTKTVDLLFGDRKQELFDHIAKKNDGYVPSTAVTTELTEIMESIKELKNS